MNKALLVGRLTREPELKTTGSGTSVCTFSLAVQRKYKNADGEYEADFINCVAWRNQAEFLAKFFNKGSMVGIVGSIQTRNYEKNGQRVYITEVVADEVEFVGSKDNGSYEPTPHPSPAATPSPQGEGFGEEGFGLPVPDGDAPF